MESTKRLEDEEDINYWKSQTKYFQQRYADVQQELDDYTEKSADLEKELEASLEQVEDANRDLTQQNQRLRNEIDSLKNKLKRSIQETTALESELKTLHAEKEKQAAYVRELEQKNDDLERGQRVITESISCIEALLNQAYERNAVLESEVDEIESLRVNLQRANDEARDLKQELTVREKVPGVNGINDNEPESVCVNGDMQNGDSHSQVETETQTNPMTPIKREMNGNTLNPSAHMSAMNIVGDLLRKVGLERFLCPECRKVRCICEKTHTERGEHTNRTSLINSRLLTAQPNEREIKTPNEMEHKDEIEYRRPNVYSMQRQLSNSSSAHSTSSTNTGHGEDRTKRYSQDAFGRAHDSEHGKLRRSFVARSRDGITTLFARPTTRKTNTSTDTQRLPMSPTRTVNQLP